MNEKMTSCDGCPGLCCSDINIRLSDSDLLNLLQAGTKLQEGVAFVPPHLQWIHGSIKYDEKVIVVGEDGLPMIQGVLQRESDTVISTPIFDENGRLVLEKGMPQFDRTLTRQVDSMGVYRMKGRCGNLAADGRCSDYENRPTSCRKAERGGDFCLTKRKLSGLFEKEG